MKIIYSDGVIGDPEEHPIGKTIKESENRVRNLEEIWRRQNTSYGSYLANQISLERVSGVNNESESDETS